MAYTNHVYEVHMLKSTGELLNTAGSTGDIAVWGPGIQPHRVLALGVVLSADPAGTGAIAFDVRPTRGGDTNRTSASLGTIEWATTATFTDGSEVSVLYEELSTPVVIYPGQEVVAECTDADANNTAIRVVLLVEMIPTRPFEIETLTSGTTQMIAG